MLLENSKQDKETLRRKEKKKKYIYIFFFPPPLRFVLMGWFFTEHRSIALTRTNGAQKCSDISGRNNVASSSSKVFDRWIVGGLGPEIMRQPVVRAGSDGTAPHTDHTTICRFVDCIFFLAPGKLPACLFFARSAIVEGLATISLVCGDEECPLRFFRLRR